MANVQDFQPAQMQIRVGCLYLASKNCYQF
nr:MAG TPA: hypothetical protein [Caudoviricetes sp.]